jgi:cytochrome P450
VWAIERLLLNPDVHSRLRDEVRTLGREPDPERLAALPYLDATVKETLRTRPVVPVVGRVLKKPYRLGGYDLPAGTAVAPCIYLSHHDPASYPEPDAFRPERFLDAQPDPATYLPFGGGIRRCVGAQFALYEAKIVLGTMLAACDFEAASSGAARIVRRAVTLWPKGGTVVRVSKSRAVRAA